MKRNLLILAFVLFTTTGCVQFDVQKSLSITNDTLPQFTDGNLQLLASDEQRQKAKDRANELLAEELSLQSAIEVALLNSPSVQAMLSEYWADSSGIAMSGLSDYLI